MSTDRARTLDLPRGVAEALDAPGFDPSRPAVRQAVAFLGHADPRRLLALAGPPGTGKSAAAAFALLTARAPDAEVSVLIDGESTPHLIEGRPVAGRWVHSGHLWHNLFDQALWTSLRRAPAVVVDDLGTEPRDDRATPLFASLLCERHDHARKTILTTNLDVGAFRARYGERVLDRLGDGWWGVTGPSLRTRRAP